MLVYGWKLGRKTIYHILDTRVKLGLHLGFSLSKKIREA
jgi:hypothetical protein